MNLRLLHGTLALMLMAAAAPSAAADDQLDQVKRLYFAAKYEDALAALGSAASSSIDADEYRVLCLLGLERDGDAERVVERMVLKNPLAMPDLNGRSPKFTATYLTVRRRMLALIAQTTYGLARTSYDAGRFVVAQAQFQDLVTMLEKDAASPDLNDLRMLADGFLKLTRQRLDADALPPPRPAIEAPVEEELLVEVEALQEPSPPALDGAKPFAPWRPLIFTTDDADVVPPAIVDQQMPPWVPSPAFANVTFNGRIELLIGENGVVTAVRIIDGTHPQYDTMLVAAARRWQYSPAVKDGRAVKYRKILEFTLRAR